MSDKNSAGALTMRDRVAMLRLPEQVDTATASNRTNWLPWALTLLLAFSTVSLFIRSLQRQSTPALAPTMDRSAASTVTVASAKSGVAQTVVPGAVALESKGYIIPAHQIQVSPVEVAGRIMVLNVEEGKRFKKDDVLAVLDTASFEADFQEAKGNLANARARLDELKNGSRPEEIEQAAAELKETEESLKQAKLRYERNQQIGPTALSADEFEQSQYSYTSLMQKAKRLQKLYELIKLGPRVERIAMGEADLQQAEAKLRKAKWRLDNCTIRAPIDGTILKKAAELGNLVSPQSFNVASSVCDMADLSDLEVELEINERDVSKVLVSQPCKIKTEAWPDRVYSGTVDRLMPIANRSKGAIPVRVKVRVPKDEEGIFLKPEMGAIVTFLQLEKKQ